MGTYAELYLDHFVLHSQKNEFSHEIISLFHESDKEIIKYSPETAHLFEDYEPEDYTEEELQQLKIVQFSTKAKLVRERLDLRGFTRKNAERHFELGRNHEIEYIKERISYFKDSSDKESSKIMVESYTKDLNALKYLTPDRWLKSLEKINRLRLRTYYTHEEREKLPTVMRYMVGDHKEFYGFPMQNDFDYFHFIRLSLEAVDDEAELIYDLSQFVSEDWVTEDELIPYAEERFEEGYDVTRRIIIITEGNTDTLILRRSINLLYPHLADQFRFLDFDGVRIAGGAGASVNIVKAFAGVGIINRVIALFDNDTAAEVALRGLSAFTLPPNIVIQKYPDLDLAKNYPTLGPTGIADMDINGLAGSVELYLGEDVLRDGNGNLLPIQWKGYDFTIRKYQGEIINKSEIQKRFDEKITICEKYPSMIEKYDWSGVRAIIDEMCKAFHPKD